jgi:hypothetical protein
MPHNGATQAKLRHSFIIIIITITRHHRHSSFTIIVIRIITATIFIIIIESYKGYVRASFVALVRSQCVCEARPIRKMCPCARVCTSVRVCASHTRSSSP